MPVSVSVQRIDAAFSRSITGTKTDFDVVTVKSAGALRAIREGEA